MWVRDGEGGNKRANTFKEQWTLYLICWLQMSGLERWLLFSWSCNCNQSFALCYLLSLGVGACAEYRSKSIQQRSQTVHVVTSTSAQVLYHNIPSNFATTTWKPKEPPCLFGHSIEDAYKWSCKSQERTQETHQGIPIYLSWKVVKRCTSPMGSITSCSDWTRRQTPLPTTISVGSRWIR